MERFIVREPRAGGADFPLGNQIMAFPANAARESNMIPPETIYLSGPFASEFPSVQRVNTAAVNLPHNTNAQRIMGALHNMNAQHNMTDQNDTNAQYNMTAQRNINAQHNMNAQHKMTGQHNTNPQHNMTAQHNMNVQHYMTGQHDTNAQHNMTAQRNMNSQHNMNAHHNINAHLNMISQHNMTAQNNMNAQHNMTAQHNMNAQHNMQMGQAHSFVPNILGQGHVSGIDPRYLAGYSDNSAQFIVGGQQIQKNATPINSSFSNEYQNRSFNGIDRNKPKSFAQQVNESARIESTSHSRQIIGQENKNFKNNQQKSSMLPKKPNEFDLLRKDVQNQIVSRADKLKALHRSGPRSFSGPVEKVLKWHKSLQDIGVLVFYEIVAKCVSVRPGESCSKNLVVRDDNGPAMQVVYYEIDFLLPELKPPCIIRVIGRMMAGTCRLQAFNVRPATGDDVATLPRRAAVAAHHVAKLCKEYGPNSL